MNSFRAWYIRNSDEITWFLIGFLISDALVEIGRQDYQAAGISCLVAGINYFFYAKR